MTTIDSKNRQARGLALLRVCSVAVAVIAAGWVSLAPNTAAAAPRWVNCKVQAIYEAGPNHPFPDANTMSVGCTNELVAGTGIYYIMLKLTGASPGVTNVEKQNRFLSMAQGALLSGRQFRAYILDTTCPNSPTNCRLATAWSLYVF